MNKSAAMLALVGPLVFVGLAAGQAPAPPGGGPTIRATASEVLLDLVVRDKRGKPVRNLKPGEVEIREDGVRQDIKSFRFVAAHEAPSEQSGTTTPRQVAASRPLRAVNPVCIVFHNLDPVSRRRAIEAVQEFLQTNLPPETYVGMFQLDDRLTALYPFTNNRSDLLQAAANAFSLAPLNFTKASEAILTANPSQAAIVAAVDYAAHSASIRMQVSGGEVSNTVIAGADVSTGTGANLLRGDQVKERRDFSNITGMRETDKIITMIEQLGALPGRKSVLLVSTGLLTTGDPDRFQSILTKANQSGMTIYALDVAGLSEYGTAQAADIAIGRVAGVSRTQTQNPALSSLEAAKEKSRQGDTMNDAVRSSDTQASLRELSEATGGFLIANTNEFRKPFQRIMEDVDAHYEASYRPSSDRYDGHFRKIEVKLARADLRVESRSGYFAMPDIQGSAALLPFETLALAVLNSSPRPHAFDFHAGAFRFHHDGTNSRGALVFELPGTSLTATPKNDRQVLHASLLALVKDRNGQVVDKFSLDAPYEVPNSNLPALRASAAMYTHPVSLPPGRYTVESAVLDREGGRASAHAMQFDSPEPRQDVGLSSVVLLQRVEAVGGQDDPSDPLVFQGKRLVPFLDTNLKADAKPYVYFVVYPDRSSAEKPKLQVEFRVGGQVVADQTSDLPAPDASGAIPMIIRAATHAGECALKITALQGSTSATENISYTIAAQ